MKGYAMNFVTYEKFKEEWLREIKDTSTSTVEKGRKFSVKLITQWLDNDLLAESIQYCDGAKDGGIDIALLDDSSKESENSDESQINEGNTWYIIQGKYGTSFSGESTILEEGMKVINTLSNNKKKLNKYSGSVIEKIEHFRENASPYDKIILLFATEDYLSDSEKDTLSVLRTYGREKLGDLFDVDSISIELIYDRLEEGNRKKFNFSLKGNVSLSGDNLLVGSLSLIDLYDFLKKYRQKTGDLDYIYEKNVRRFLGGRGKVNRGMKKTLEENPEKFGLYNNGITIVVQDFNLQDDNIIHVDEPFIVNGCQTTRTIWETFDKKLGSGGTSKSNKLAEWEKLAKKGVVIVKIVKAGDNGDNLLQEITRFTNSQNAVKEKDFIALVDQFKKWQKEVSDNYDIYLEIQRGGWDSQKVLQREKPNTKYYQKYAAASDLLKVYGAGWLNKPGMAYGKNSPFLPDGSVFKEIIALSEKGNFSSSDLYAAYLLQVAAEPYKFGRYAEKSSRKQSRYLFFYIVLNLLRDCLIRYDQPSDNVQLSNALLAIFKDDSAKTALLDSALEVIDGYLTKGLSDTAFEEKVMEKYNSDLNTFLKSERLGESEDFSPNLQEQLKITKKIMERKNNNLSINDKILNALKQYGVSK